jgi:hypothetical protein
MKARRRRSPVFASTADIGDPERLAYRSWRLGYQNGSHHARAWIEDVAERQSPRSCPAGAAGDAARWRAFPLPLSGSRKAFNMSADAKAIETAAEGLAHAMAQLVRAIDAGGDDGEAAKYISDEMPHALEELASRISAAKGFSD